MSKLVPKVSRIKRGCAETVANHMLMRKACEVAGSEGRPFTIVDGYDSAVLGAYTEYTIWYKEEAELTVFSIDRVAAVVTDHRVTHRSGSPMQIGYTVTATGDVPLKVNDRLYLIP